MSKTYKKEELCKCCGKRPIAGYIGNGRYLEDLCRKCWQRNPNVKAETGEFWAIKKAAKK
jgi:hypothetical protein